jgi:hypothetical protein
MRRIVPSVTTHGTTGHSWEEKIEEVEALGLREIGLFVTGLNDSDRTRCYRLLEEVQSRHSFSVLFVHAVSSMNDEEYRYLRTQFRTEWFNLHPMWDFPLLHELSEEVRSWILIENSSIVRPLQRDDMDGFAGICFDLSHLEDSRRGLPQSYPELVTLAHHLPVHANHISAVPTHADRYIDGVPHYSRHHVAGLHEMEYLAGLPASTIAPLCALELEDPLAVQLDIIPLIRRFLDGACSLPRAA